MDDTSPTSNPNLSYECTVSRYSIPTLNFNLMVFLAFFFFFGPCIMEWLFSLPTCKATEFQLSQWPPHLPLLIPSFLPLHSPPSFHCAAFFNCKFLCVELEANNEFQSCLSLTHNILHHKKHWNGSDQRKFEHQRFSTTNLRSDDLYQPSLLGQ